MMTDDWQEVVGHNLRRAILCKKWLKVQAFQREGDVGADFSREHQLMPKPLKMNTQDLKKEQPGIQMVRNVYKC